ncbi:hypothetical protein [Bradyrhizobium sp. McL0616]|uniref:hypothetical protein n=1 Tax=Bradyrhizobium sp. McL0616 TaxID=3415674 RepID=UPI003CF05659
MAGTSLWPVVLGGLLTGAFTLGGIGVGLFGAARRDAAQEHRDLRERRADKFEELVAAVYEYDHWLALIRSRDAFGIDSAEPQSMSPFAKVQAITSVYFPRFNAPVRELESTADQYLIWIYDAERKRVSKDAKYADGFDGSYRPYCQKREALLDALKEFAHKEFQ